MKNQAQILVRKAISRSFKLGLGGNPRPLKIFDAICAKYDISVPDAVRANANVINSFISSCVNIKNRNRETVEAHLIARMNELHKRELKRREAGASPRKDLLPVFFQQQKADVKPTNWGYLAFFFGKNEAEIKVISHLNGDKFYKTKEWLSLRYFLLKQRGPRCECCGATRSPETAIHVDHIFPRSTCPDLALNPTNLQVLCDACNLGKSNSDTTDWREEVAA